MVAESVVTSIKKYLRRVEDEGIPIDYGVLFGSQARGEAGIWSDIDLLVVSPRYDVKRTREDIDLLWCLAAFTDSRIEPVAVGAREFETNNSSPILAIARREGQKITLT